MVSEFGWCLFSSKCWNVLWVWPAAPNSFCVLCNVFMLFLVLGRPQGQKVGAFWSKSDENRINSEINVPNHGLTSKTTSKCTGTLGGGGCRGEVFWYVNLGAHFY